MTPSHDHETLFIAPSAPPAADAADAADRREQTADDGAEAMRQLRHPFTVQPDRTDEDTESSDKA